MPVSFTCLDESGCAEKSFAKDEGEQDDDEKEKLVADKQPTDPAEIIGTQSSTVVIFSVWKTMVGTAVMSLPWAYQESGFVLGLIITFVAFLISFYTCKIIVDASKHDLDYSLTLKKYYGKQALRD
jgi:hypothetical protein